MTRRRTALIVVQCAAIVGVVLIVYFSLRDRTDDLRDLREYEFPPRAFDGPSTRLSSSVIVPTLDAPIPQGKSAIWCGSFQLAWNELRNMVVREPIVLTGAEEVAGRLNESTFTRNDLADGEYYAAAGLVKDGIVDRIHNEMRSRFPDWRIPDFGDGNVAVAYACLQGKIQFPLPYFEDELHFANSSGQWTRVKAFGLRHKDFNKMRELRQQIAVLFTGVPFEQPSEFALDLCVSSNPDQIVVARVPRRETLAATLKYVQNRIAEASKKSERRPPFGLGDELLVPTMHWRIDHDFEELMGPDKRFENAALKGLYVHRACQTVQFKLDRSGADLKSDAGIMAKSQTRQFILDGPYLIYMQKRGAANPFFVMWVDNAELMVK